MQGLVAEAGRPTPEQIGGDRRARAGQRARAREHAPQLRRPDLAARRVRRGGRGGARARRRRAPRRRAPLQRLGRGRHRALRRGRALADTVTICFSKGLGCPLGAVLAGPAETDRARLGGEVPLRRRAAAVRHRRGRDALRARPQRRAARRGSRARAAARRRDRARPGDASRRTSFRFPTSPACASGCSSAASASAASGPGWLRAVTHLGVGDEEIEQAIELMQEVLSVHV